MSKATKDGARGLLPHRCVRCGFGRLLRGKSAHLRGRDCRALRFWRRARFTKTESSPNPTQSKMHARTATVGAHADATITRKRVPGVSIQAEDRVM